MCDENIKYEIPIVPSHTIFVPIILVRGGLGSKFTGANTLKTDLLFGYDYQHMTHQPRTAFDFAAMEDLNFFWDANGNLAQIMRCMQGGARLHEWDEENRLRFVLGDKYAGYYGYDGNGERVYKLTGDASFSQINSGTLHAQAVFDNGAIYPNPYMVITPKYYTKHYYAGTERLATVIGTGGFAEVIPSEDVISTQEDYIAHFFFTNYEHQNEDPFHYENAISEPVETEDIYGQQDFNLDYDCDPIELEAIDVLAQQDIFGYVVHENQYSNNQETDRFFYHGDHLGSATWITDAQATPVQYIHYAPYGELIANQMSDWYDERYKFTGKERDYESGYDAFGARYYWSDAGIWTGVDPLSDKFPEVSPYMYCHGDPINRIDLDGRVDWSVIWKGAFTAACGVGTTIAGAGIAGGTSGLAAPIGALLIVDGISATGIGASLFLYGLMTDPCEKNTQLLNSIPTSATNALSKSADIIAGTERHEIENSVDGLMIVTSGKPKWKTSSEKFVSITTALESVSLISKVAGENESKGIENSSPYTEIVQRQDNTRCPVAEKPQPLKLDNNNL